MANRKARIAVIGTGWWATTAHIPALLANPRAELVAVCDADTGRLAAAAQEFGIGATYADHRELLAREQLDGAIVATPHATHYALARDCLAAGLHTLIEKPMTLYAAHARELVQLAAQNDRELMVGYTWHYNRLVDGLRDLLAGGELGRPQLVMCVFNSYCIDLYRGNDHSDRPGAYRVHGPGAAEQVIALGEGEPHYPLGAPADNLVALALGAGVNRAPGEPGWRTVEILDAAYRSARAGGQPVAVDDLYI